MVTVGYPERTITTPVKNYNSLVTVSPEGNIVATYRKSFLYYTDETWASEGDKGFFHGDLGSLGPACMGICMDINPYRFQTSWTAYEFAKHCAESRTPLIVLSMAWLTQLTPDELSSQAQLPDMETLAYWIERFVPIMQAERADEVVLVLANRCGLEPGTVAGVTRGVDEDGEGVVGYAGTSSVLRVKDGQVMLYDFLGRAQQDLLVVDTEKVSKSAYASSDALMEYYSLPGTLSHKSRETEAAIHPQEDNFDD